MYVYSIYMYILYICIYYIYIIYIYIYIYAYNMFTDLARHITSYHHVFLVEFPLKPKKNDSRGAAESLLSASIRTASAGPDFTVRT